jgi:hypothetical protein
MLGYILSNEVITNKTIKNYEVLSFDVLSNDLTKNIYVIRNHKILFIQIHKNIIFNNSIINNASKIGCCRILKWYEKSGYKILKYYENAIINAVRYGHVNVLEWFIQKHKIKMNKNLTYI